MKRLNILLFAFLFTAGVAFAQTNEASIDQIGNDHDASIDQTGDLNQAFILQTADLGREGDDVGTATIEQEGSSNLVNLDQRSFYGDSEANIVQIGSNNSVHGTSEGEAFKQNHGLNIIDVFMEGDRNTLYSLRGEAQKNVNTFELDIMGSDNEVGMMQEYGLGFIDIEGDFNEVLLNQKSGSANFSTATIDVFGDSNNIDVYQRKEDNQATVDINGSWNSASISQQ